MSVAIGILYFLVLLIIAFLITVIVLYFTGKIGQYPSVSSTIITLNSGGNYINNYFQLFGSQTFNQQYAQIVVPKSGTISNLYVKNTGSNNDNKAIFLYINNQSSLIVSLTNDQTTGINNQIVNVNAGDLISVQYRVDGTVPNYGGAISFTLTS